MSLILRRSAGQQLLVVPDRPHTADEVTAIDIKYVDHLDQVTFAFEIGVGYSICLGEKYQQRHGHDLTEERCVNCGQPIGLYSEEDREPHAGEDLCYICAVSKQ